MTVLSAAIPATESTVGFCCGCCVTGDCYDDSDCEHGSTEVLSIALRYCLTKIVFPSSVIGKTATAPLWKILWI